MPPENCNFPEFPVSTLLTIQISIAMVESGEYCTKSSLDSASNEERIMRLSQLTVSVILLKYNSKIKELNTFDSCFSML